MNGQPQFVAVVVPAANGSGTDVHAAMVTSSVPPNPGSVDAGVHDGEGHVANINATVFPDLGAPHPVAGIPMFDSLENAVKAIEAYAEKGLKFICAYAPQETAKAQEWMAAELQKVRDQVSSHAAAISEITAKLEPKAGEAAPAGDTTTK